MSQEKYEIISKSKIHECIEGGIEFFICDMDKKRVYSSYDLRLREIDEKISSPDTFVFKKASYGEVC